MKTPLLTLAASLLLVAVTPFPANLFAQGTAFTYQGRLVHGGGPANGLYELSFALYDAVTNGNIVGAPVTIAPVLVSNGLFTATLDLGANAFTGADRWMEIAVTVFGSDQPVVTLQPRQPITPAPYALHAANAAGLMSSVNAPLDIKVNGQRALRIEPIANGVANLIGGSADNYLDSGVAGAVIGGGEFNSAGSFAVVAGGRGNRASGYAATVAGGEFNESAGLGASAGGGFNNRSLTSHDAISGGINNIAQGGISVVVGGQHNVSSGFGSVVGGGEDNVSRGGHDVVGGGRRNVSSAFAATVSGGKDNVASDSGAVIGGGEENLSASICATVCGGRLNRSAFWYASVGGGLANVSTGLCAAIAGGYNNTNRGSYSAIGGGDGNLCIGWWATVAGGRNNSARAAYSTVPGGAENTASHVFSFAAGRCAQAMHEGAFVWADASGRSGPLEIAIPFASSADNEFAVRATGGVRFVTAIDTNGSNIAGVALAPGSGSWSSLSDRHAKENIAAANAREILDKVAILPMASWNYKAQGAGVRHLGPMAQDFHAAFGLGESERTIATVDADGVALAAIQGLNEKVEVGSQRSEVRIQKLETENAELKKALADLKEKVERLAQLRK